jgi:hypothetical protein
MFKGIKQALKRFKRGTVTTAPAPDRVVTAALRSVRELAKRETSHTGAPQARARSGEAAAEPGTIDAVNNTELDRAIEKRLGAKIVLVQGLKVVNFGAPGGNC